MARAIVLLLFSLFLLLGLATFLGTAFWAGMELYRWLW